MNLVTYHARNTPGEVTINSNVVRVRQKAQKNVSQNETNKFMQVENIWYNASKFLKVIQCTHAAIYFKVKNSAE